ncbi:MAG TPA: RNA methyltransferase [Ktedonobacteraceae bacterium]|nr:RNA methyltransferase [Ktedonobacteraceae bacterium]
MTLITSPANPRISLLRTLQTSRGRKKNELFLMEGLHLLEVLLDARLLPQEIYYQPALMQRTPQGSVLLVRMLGVFAGMPERLIEVSERVIEAISEVQTSQGVVCVLPLTALQAANVQARRLPRSRPVLLLLDSISDPGNMGTLLRTALAADVEMVLLTPGSVDYYSPKVVRAAAGAHVALPVAIDVSWSTIAEHVARHCQGSPRVYLADAGSPHLYYEQDFVQPCVLVIGNEAHGPSSEARALATLPISIPLANGVESLNAAMAGGIILYEAVRQIRLSQAPSSS